MRSANRHLFSCLLLATHCSLTETTSMRYLETKVLEFFREHGEQGVRPSATEIIHMFERRQAALQSNLSRARVVFFTTQSMAGLGNRMVALVSAFLMSVCTDRALIVDWPDYDKPTVHRSTEVSTMLPIDRFFDQSSTYDARVILSTKQRVAELGWDHGQWASLSDHDASAFKLLQTDDLNILFPQRVLSISAISLFGRLLESNPVHGPWLRAHFGANPFPEAARYVLQPAPAIRDAAARLYLSLFAGRRIVALHLRTIEYMSARQQAAALHCAQFLAGGNASSVFVASDTEAGMATAARVLGPDFLSYQTVPPGRAGEAALVDGFVNLIMMSRADALVGTSRSSFTLLAAGLHGGGTTSWRPFYDVFENRCFRVTCHLPTIQRDNPLAVLVDGYNGTCIEGAIALDAPV